MPTRLTSLKALNNNGRRLMEDHSMSETDKQNIKKDLDIMAERWNRVSTDRSNYSKA